MKPLQRIKQTDHTKS